MMRIGVTEKVKNFEIDPIFAEKVIQKKLMEGGNFTPPPPTWNRVKYKISILTYFDTLDFFS